MWKKLKKILKGNKFRVFKVNLFYGVIHVPTRKEITNNLSLIEARKVSKFLNNNS